MLRGRPESGSFSVFYFQDERLVAINSVNRAADHVVGRHMLGAGMSPSAAECADEGVDLKRLFKSSRAAGETAGHGNVNERRRSCPNGVLRQIKAHGRAMAYRSSCVIGIITKR